MSYQLIDQTLLDNNLQILSNLLKEKTNANNSLTFPSDFITKIESCNTNKTWFDKTKPVGEIIFTGTTIPTHFLYQKSGITGFTAINATKISQNCFYECTSLASITLIGANITVVDQSAFYKTTSLTQAICVPNAQLVTGAFSNSRISCLVYKNQASGNYNFFKDNPNLTTIDKTGAGMFGGSNAAANCTNFNTLILRSSSICTLPQTNVFSNTPFASGKAGGTIYIPESLYDHLGDESELDYKAATNWSTMDGYGTVTWAKIEGSIYETQYADGTPIPTA